MKNRPIARCLTAAFSIVTEALVALQVLSERRKLVAMTLAVAALTGATAATAKDLTPADKGNGWSLCDERYLALYEQAHKAGFDVGRNRVDDGKLLASGEAVLEPRPCAQADKLDLMLNPPEPTVASSIPTDVAPSTPATTSVAPSSDLASIAACESGGDYTTNTGNGYSGAYQFDDATWQAAGGSTQSAYQASPAEQDAVAAGWIAAGNRGAWPNC